MPDPNQLYEYLGDGVYAQFVPATSEICLLVERPEHSVQLPNVMRVDRVLLNSTALEALVRFADRVWPVNVPEDVPEDVVP